MIKGTFFLKMDGNLLVTKCTFAYCTKMIKMEHICKHRDFYIHPYKASPNQLKK